MGAVAHSPHCHVPSAKHVGFKGPGARGRREVSHNPRRPVLAVPTHPANGAEAVASSALQQPLGRANAQVWLTHSEQVVVGIHFMFPYKLTAIHAHMDEG